MFPLHWGAFRKILWMTNLGKSSLPSFALWPLLLLCLAPTSLLLFRSLTRGLCILLWVFFGPHTQASSEDFNTNWDQRIFSKKVHGFWAAWNNFEAYSDHILVFNRYSYKRLIKAPKRHKCEWLPGKIQQPTTGNNLPLHNWIKLLIFSVSSDIVKDKAEDIVLDEEGVTQGLQHKVLHEGLRRILNLSSWACELILIAER